MAARTSSTTTLPLDLPHTPASQAPAAGRDGVPEFSVSELSLAIKRLVEGRFGHVRLRGEISGYRGPHSSGHAYFSLKDDKAKIDAVIWRGVFARLKFKPEEGLEVVVQGKITTFAGKSSYQIMIEHLEPAGAGALMALLEERKRQLAAEGLFDDSRKQPLPFLPRVIGIVTSPTGAVIRDMMHGFTERFPAHVVLWPVRVQGETCGAEVAAAIRGFNALSPGDAVPRPDVLIVARGGGSLEDLWGFNDEAVVRAAAASQIPLISAVGHETDWTLIDLAADARAPTPTKAAEWAVPKYSELLERIDDQARRLHISLRRLLEERRARLTAAMRGLPRAVDLLAMPRQRFDATAARLSLALRNYTQARRSAFEARAGKLQPLFLQQRMAQLAERLEATHSRGRRAFASHLQRQRTALDAQGKLLLTLSHKSVLARGFALVRDAQGHPIRFARDITAGTPLDLEFADGHRQVTATEGTASRTAKPRTPGRKTKKPPRFSPDGQGSLF